MPICKTCREDKKKHAKGQCAQCYWVDYQKEIRRRQKQKAGDLYVSAINPQKIMFMKPEQIIQNWPKILRGAGL